MFSSLLRAGLRRWSLLALLGTSVTALPGAEPTRLREIAVLRLDRQPDGVVWEARALLTEFGAFKLQRYGPALQSISYPPEALNKVLIPAGAHRAYADLGDEALINFAIDPESPIWINDRAFYEVDLAPEPKWAHGRPLNLSTRAQISPGRPLIGGFVVEGASRWFLIRALGPSLRPAGVADAIADPFLTLYQGATPIAFNDDWATRPEADAIATISAHVGASPLPRASKEAALLVELEAGNYSVHVQSTGNQETGEAMFEIFVVDEP